MKALERAQIERLPARPDQNAASGVSEAAIRRDSERARVKPSVDGALASGQISVAGAIRNAADHLCVGGIRSRKCGGEIFASLRGVDSAQLPAAEHPIHGSPSVQV